MSIPSLSSALEMTTNDSDLEFDLSDLDISDEEIQVFIPGKKKEMKEEKEEEEEFEPPNALGVRYRKGFSNNKKDSTFSHQEPIIKWMIARETTKRLGIRGGVLCSYMGSGKCNGFDTPILLKDGSIKMVQDIKVGDELLGDDNTTRNVLSLCRGRDKMYKVHQNKGDAYSVNSAHILSLKITANRSIYWSEERKKYVIMWVDKEVMRVREKSFIVRKAKFKKERKYDSLFESRKEALEAAEEYLEKIDDLPEEDKHYNGVKYKRHKTYSWKRGNTYEVIVFDVEKEKYIYKSFSLRKEQKPIEIIGGYATKEEAYEAVLKFKEALPSDDIVDIEIEDYLKLPQSVKDRLKGYKVGFNFPEQKVEIDPRFLGMWLGDGTSSAAEITTEDIEIVEYLEKTFPNHIIHQGSGIYDITTRFSKNLEITDEENKINHQKFIKERGPHLRFYIGSKGKKGKRCNSVLNFLKDKNLLNNKHIPIKYLVNSRKVRLELLAGLIDTDGSYANGCYEITQKSKVLIDQIAYLVRSLGFYASISLKNIDWPLENDKTKPLVYHRLLFSGEGIEEIPVLLKRKVASKREQKKDVLVTDIKIEELPEDNYYGFETDGNHRYLLGDFTVTHNSFMSLTVVMADYASSTPPEYPTLIVVPCLALLTWRDEIEKFFGSSCPYLLYRRDALGDRIDQMTVEELKKYRVILTNYDTIRTIAKKYSIYDNLFDRDSVGRKTGIYGTSKPSAKDMTRVGSCAIFHAPYHRMICDESHKFNNPHSALYYSMMSIWAERKWAVTGTPIRNYRSDAFSQYRVIGLNTIINASHFTYNYYIEQKLDQFLLYIEIEDTEVKLPELIREQRTIILKEREKEMYDYLLNATHKAFDGHYVGCMAFSNILTLFLRLRQCCLAANTVTSDDKKTERTYAQSVIDDMTNGLNTWVNDIEGTAGVKSAKNLEIIRILTDEVKAKEKTIIFTSSKRMMYIMELALNRIPKCKDRIVIINGDVTGKRREKAFYKFKGPDYDILILSYEIGSTSLNLQCASGIILTEPVWSHATTSQAIARSWRIGQTKKVKVWEIVVKDSIEDRMIAKCKEKEEMSRQFLVHGRKVSPTGIEFNAEMISSLIGY